MKNRLGRLLSLASTMHKLEDVAHAEVHSRREDETRAYARAKQAHAIAAAARTESGSVQAFLASRQVAQFATGAVVEAEDAQSEAEEQTRAAVERLREAQIRCSAMERLTQAARVAAQEALDAADAAVVDDMVAARAARLKREGLR